MDNKLNILWTTDNKDTVFNMLSMYAINSLSRKWWEQVNVIICCDRFEVTERLTRLGVSVRYMGEPLTQYLKNNEKLITI